MNPELYHGDMEGNDWPHRHHFHSGASAYCGRHVHEIHNHDFWNTRLGGKEIDTNTYPDVCFAYR